MQTKSLRFTVIEHPIGMLIATILIHIGKGMFNKEYTAKVKGAGSYRRFFIILLVALLIILASIPWTSSTY